MAGKTFVDNPDYMKQIDLIKKLHLLMAQGKGDTEEADTVREQVYPSWGQLTPAEMDRVNALSADLYMLDGTEVVQVGEAKQRSREWLAPQLMAAWNQQDWGTILALLRTGPDPEYLPRDRVAYFRGRGWAHFGHPDIAVLFFDYAAKLNPNDVGHQVSAMEALIQGGQLSSALQRANAVITKPASDPRLFFQAADVLFTALQPLPKEQACSVSERIIKVLEEALKKEQQVPPDPQWMIMAARACMEKGLCHVRLGQSDAGLDAYARALTFAPNHPATLTARGILLYRSNREREAVIDFEQAARTRTPLVLPYFFLAHWSLIQRDYSKCLEWCDEALRRTRLPALLANLFEWKAIARWEQGAAPESVRTFFEEALNYAPFDDRLQHNYSKYLESVKGAGREKTPWEIDTNEIRSAAENHAFEELLPYRNGDQGALVAAQGR